MQPAVAVVECFSLIWADSGLTLAPKPSPWNPRPTHPSRPVVLFDCITKFITLQHWPSKSKVFSAGNSPFPRDPLRLCIEIASLAFFRNGEFPCTWHHFPVGVFFPPVLEEGCGMSSKIQTNFGNKSMRFTFELCLRLSFFGALSVWLSWTDSLVGMTRLALFGTGIRVWNRDCMLLQLSRTVQGIDRGLSSYRYWQQTYNRLAKEKNAYQKKIKLYTL